jgi:hypothetical protein
MRWRLWPFSRRAKVVEASVAAAVAAVRDVTQQSETEQAAGRVRNLSRDYVYPDYVDYDALNALAAAKGVIIDPVGIGLSRSTTTGSSIGDETAVGIRTPLAEARVSASTTFSEEGTVGQSISVQRRQTMRWLVDQITAVLRSEAALSDDLAVVPEACENEIALTLGIRIAIGEWGLGEIDKAAVAALRETLATELASVGQQTSEQEPPAAQERTELGPPAPQIEGSPKPHESRTENSAAAEEEKKEEKEEKQEDGFTFNPQQPTPFQLTLALQTVSFAAADVVRETAVEMIDARLASANRTLFALVTLEWGYRENYVATSYLWNGGVVTRQHPQQMTFGPAFIQVPIDKAKLNPLAQGRYVDDGPYQPLQVFGKIEKIESRNIVLTPIVILSS